MTQECPTVIIQLEWAIPFCQLAVELDGPNFQFIATSLADPVQRRKQGNKGLQLKTLRSWAIIAVLIVFIQRNKLNRWIPIDFTEEADEEEIFSTQKCRKRLRGWNINVVEKQHKEIKENSSMTNKFRIGKKFVKKFAILLSLFILSLPSLSLSLSLYNSIKCVRVCHHAPLTSKAYFFLFLCRKIFSEPFDFIWILGSVRSISRNICLLRCCKNAKKHFKAGKRGFWSRLCLNSNYHCIVLYCNHGLSIPNFHFYWAIPAFLNLSLKTRECD